MPGNFKGVEDRIYYEFLPLIEENRERILVADREGYLEEENWVRITPNRTPNRTIVGNVANPMVCESLKGVGGMIFYLRDSGQYEVKFREDNRIVIYTLQGEIYFTRRKYMGKVTRYIK